MAPDDETQPGWAAPPPNPGWGAPPPETPPPAASGWGSAPPTSPIGVGSEPPSMTPGQPVTRARRRWIWVLIASVVGVIGLYAVDAVLFTQKIKPPIDATNAFVHDIRYHDYASAQRRLCASDRGNVSVETLARALGSDPILGTFTGYSVNPLGVRFHGNGVNVDFTLNYPLNRTSDRTLHLVKENGKWRPCGFSNGSA
ncbi:MAG TPA: hypothetical protein VF441_06215 [Acidimicrobiia bacterium]